MTPQQAADHLAAKRTDAPTDYALLTDGRAASCLAMQAAVVSMVAMDRAELEAFAESLRTEVMPPEVTERIKQALKEEATK